MLAEHGPTADIPLPDPIPETPTLPVRKMRKAVGVRGLRVDLHRVCDPARSVIVSSRMPSAGFSALMGTGEELVPLIDGRPHTGAGVQVVILVSRWPGPSGGPPTRMWTGSDC